MVIYAQTSPTIYFFGKLRFPSNYFFGKLRFSTNYLFGKLRFSANYLFGKFLFATIPPSDPTHRSQGRKPRRHEKPMVVHARKAPHGSHSLLIRKFRIVQPHRQRRRRYRPPCQRHPPLCRFANNKNHDLRSSVNHAHGFYAVQLSFSIKSMYSCHSKSKPRNQKKITLKRDKHKPHHPPCWRIAQEPIPISPDNN